MIETSFLNEKSFSSKRLRTDQKSQETLSIVAMTFEDHSVGGQVVKPHFLPGTVMTSQQDGVAVGVLSAKDLDSPFEDHSAGGQVVKPQSHPGTIEDSSVWRPGCEAPTTSWD